MYLYESPLGVPNGDSLCLVQLDICHIYWCFFVVKAEIKCLLDSNDISTNNRYCRN